MYTLDTHATIRDLEAAGVETRQAEAIVSAISHADEHLATKADIARLDGHLAGLDGHLAGLDGRIAGLDSRLNVLQWVVGIQSAVILAIALRVFGLV